jgi:hypothetical protein
LRRPSDDEPRHASPKPRTGTANADRRTQNPAPPNPEPNLKIEHEPRREKREVRTVCFAKFERYRIQDL